uniref:Secreted protein n=1 Tax=Octopus bimaculoides TaxID=37653 RepID=A0A0L8FN89_OCTBM
MFFFQFFSCLAICTRLPHGSILQPTNLPSLGCCTIQISLVAGNGVLPQKVLFIMWITIHRGLHLFTH